MPSHHIPTEQPTTAEYAALLLDRVHRDGATLIRLYLTRRDELTEKQRATIESLDRALTFQDNTPIL